jgi:hypothetical protein
MAVSINNVTGFAIENKLICSTKVAITNSFLYFKDSLDALFTEKLIFAQSDAQYYHSFLKLLNLLSFKTDVSNILSEKIELTRVDCIPRSRKFYFPPNIISLKDEKDLILKLDDEDDGSTEILTTTCLYNKNANNLSQFIDQSAIRIEDAFGESFPCPKKHQHKDCVVTLNNTIEKEKINSECYNKDENGVEQFDNLINWIKILQRVDFELIAILYLEILNNQNYSKSLKQLKEKITILNNKITLKDFGYFILLCLRRNNRINLFIELIECHTSQNIFGPDMAGTKSAHLIAQDPMRDFSYVNRQFE